MEFLFNIPLIRYIMKKRDMKKAKEELLKMLTELSDDGLEYVWRPIAYAYYWTDEHGIELMSKDDMMRINLVCAVAHEPPEVVDRLAHYRACLTNRERR